MRAWESSLWTSEWRNPLKAVVVVVVRCNIFCVSSGLQETGPREGVVVAGVCVVGEGEAWAAGKASTLAASATLTDTAAATNRE